MYYVYALINPRTDEIFYIGKGKGNRKDSHCNESEWWYNKRKAGRIRYILEAGLQPKSQILHDNLNEEDAKSIESKLIESYGRIGFDEGGKLLNICIDSNPPSRLGKQGTFKGKHHTQATKDKLREYNKKQFEDNNQRIIRSNRSKELWTDPTYRAKQVESRKDFPATKPSQYIVHFPAGESILIENLHKWCKDNDYPCGTLRDTLPQRKNKPAKSGKAKGMWIRLN